jgi:glycosyltransferase involved in cell wall biosynthesis
MNDSRKTVRPQPRIVHFCFALDSSKGGVPAGVLLSVMQLTKFGIHNQIFSTGNTKNQIERNAIDHANLANVGVVFKYSPARIKNSYGIGSLKGLNKDLAGFSKPNFVVLHQVYTLSTLLGYRYAKRFGIPFAVKPHGSLTHYHESDSMLIKFLAKKLIISKILREANAIIVTCDSEKYDLDISLQSKVCILQYGASMDERLGRGDFPTVKVSVGMRIMFSGRFDKKKNLPLLFNAMPRILSKYPDLILDIAGSGTAKELGNLKTLVRALGLEKNIDFHGWIDKTKMDELFSSTRLLVLPSENENFALVVSEALSAGVPCVVSKFVGTSDIVAKHHAGEIIDELTPESVASSVIKVLEGDENTYRAAAIQATCEDLDWSKIALRWKALISSLAVE